MGALMSEAPMPLDQGGLPRSGPLLHDACCTECADELQDRSTTTTELGVLVGEEPMPLNRGKLLHSSPPLHRAC